jgi:hypothetical protein
MKIRKIVGMDSTTKTYEDSLPGHLSEPEIIITLQRLASKHLTEREIVNSSRRKNDPSRNSLLDRIGSGNPILVGGNPHYSAHHKDE